MTKSTQGYITIPFQHQPASRTSLTKDLSEKIVIIILILLQIKPHTTMVIMNSFKALSFFRPKKSRLESAIRRFWVMCEISLANANSSLFGMDKARHTWFACDRQYQYRPMPFEGLYLSLSSTYTLSHFFGTSSFYLVLTRCFYEIPPQYLNTSIQLVIVLVLSPSRNHVCVSLFQCITLSLPLGFRIN